MFHFSSGYPLYLPENGKDAATIRAKKKSVFYFWRDGKYGKNKLRVLHFAGASVTLVSINFNKIFII